MWGDLVCFFSDLLVLILILSEPVEYSSSNALKVASELKSHGVRLRNV